MHKAERVFILAGEASGDRIGADLMVRLKRVRSPLEIAGVGGHTMQEQGLRTLFPMTDLSVMGIVDVLKSLPKLLFRLRQTRLHILKYQPDVVVLIDSQVFSSMLAKGLRRAGYAGAILLYVAPTVWVYRPERAAALKPLFNEVLAILPFEPKVLAELGGPPTCFVGHPALASRDIRRASSATSIDGDARNVAGQSPANVDQKILLMPGSRRGEIKRHLDMFRQVGETLTLDRPGLKFCLPTLPYLYDTLCARTRDWKIDLEIIVDSERRQQNQSEVCLALVASGTATLELAFADIPMVVTYVMDAAQARTYKKLAHSHISLPNIILGEPLVPELLFAKPDVTRLVNAMRELLASEEARNIQKDGFGRVAALMQTGQKDHPRQDPAERVLSYLSAPV